MSTAGPTTRLATPALVAGERLDQAEFHRRYEAMPAGARAELIGGVVRMPSPTGRDHGKAHLAAAVWLSQYAESTPGVEAINNASAILASGSEPQPDVLLRVLPEFGGGTTLEGGYVRGAPELVVEVARGTRYIDLGPKLADYERAGVQEYVVRALGPDEVLWFRRDGGALARVGPDPDGFYRSSAFPGLWLDPVAALADDTKGLKRAVDRGLASAEHAEFLARLAASRGGAAVGPDEG